MRKVFIVFLLCLSGVFVPAVRAKVAVRAEIPLGWETLGNVPTVEVTVGSRKRLFYLDTGGGVSGISPELANEIGCEPIGEMTGFNAGGMKFKIKRCENVSYSMGGYSVKRDVAVFDPNQFFPKAKNRLDGSIALDSFDGQVVSFDFAGSKVLVESDKSFKSRISDLRPMESRLSREVGGASLDVFIAANTPKGKIWLLLDTGNTNKLLFTPSAQEQLGINFIGPNGEKIIKPVKLDLIGLGEVEADGREREMIYDGMMSMDVIRRMYFTIDFRTGKMWARLR